MVKRRHIESAGAAVLTVLLITLVHQKLVRDDDPATGERTNATAFNDNDLTPGHSTTTSQATDQPSTNPRDELQARRDFDKAQRITARTLSQHLPFKLSTDHDNLLATGETDQVTNELLETAALAVRDGRDDLLGRSIAQLASLALIEGQFEAAEVYLDEATDIFELAEDDLGTAGVELLRGQLNIERRWRAREAAYAQEDMQLAGWKIAKGRVPEAIPALQSAVETNLELGRLAAAAAGYELLYRGYLRENRRSEAIGSAIEAVRLHASSDRMNRATRLLDDIEALGLDAGTRYQINDELRMRQEEYQTSVRQLGQARDYDQLYHHYVNEGDPFRAWQFRIKSHDSLTQVSKGAMHRRQTGVIALLYNSNDNIRQANRSLDQASQLFTQNAAEELKAFSDALRAEIY